MCEFMSNGVMGRPGPAMDVEPNAEVFANSVAVEPTLPRYADYDGELTQLRELRESPLDSPFQFGRDLI